MSRHQGRRGADHDPPLADLDLVLADDALIDAIAGRPTIDRPMAAPTVAEATDELDLDALLGLLAQWRDEVVAQPLPPRPVGVPVAVAMEPVRQVAAPARRRRRTRPAIAVAAAISALMLGSASIAAADATPGSPLWPLTQVLWPDKAQSAESAFRVEAAIAEATEALRAGRDNEARAAIARAVGELSNVDQGVRRDTMQAQVVLLIQATSRPSATTTDADPDRLQASLQAWQSTVLLPWNLADGGVPVPSSAQPSSPNPVTDEIMRAAAQAAQAAATQVPPTVDQSSPIDSGLPVVVPPASPEPGSVDVVPVVPDSPTAPVNDSTSPAAPSTSEPTTPADPSSAPIPPTPSVPVGPPPTDPSIPAGPDTSTPSAIQQPAPSPTEIVASTETSPTPSGHSEGQTPESNAETTADTTATTTSSAG